MRERGLKLEKYIVICPGQRVAPHAGAWIETYKRAIGFTYEEVAPHAGAWIETGYTVTSS